MYRNERVKLNLTVMCRCLVVCLGLYLSLGSVALGAQPNVSAASIPQSISDLITQTCRHIYQGEFEQAIRILDSTDANNPPDQRIQQLRDILDHYKLIEQNRLQGRKEAYEKQWQRLETLRQSKIVDDKVASDDMGLANDSEGVEDALHAADANESDTGTDPNSEHTVSEVLSVIVAINEFADMQQKKDLLADDFVRKIMRRSLERAAQFETEGQWLEAYTTCYGWLKAIEPNNPAYTEYADQLWEKAAISASFEDSPCETREQRYHGVRKEIVTRAIQNLDTYYVNTIDYSHMAIKSLERTRFLTEVLTALSSQEETKELVRFFNIDAKQELAAWSQSIEGLLDEVKQTPMGLRRQDFLSLYDRIFSLNKTTINIPEPVLVVHIAQSALTSLDPHTNIIWPNQITSFEKEMTGEFSGIGIEITKPKGKLTVASLLLDTPAYRSGLDAGDVISKIDGVPTRDMSLHCAVKRITGPKGTPVTLTVQRVDQEATLDFTIIRDTIDVPMIRGWQRTASGRWRYMIDPEDKIAYIRITSFSSTKVAGNFKKVLKQLEKVGLQGLILDLRSNTGGHLDNAVDLVDMFVKKGMIVQTKPGLGYTRVPTTQWAHRKGTHPDYPLVILINSVSASASEIVAGALADPKHQRAVLIGDRTHGKGSVQSIFSRHLYGAELKCTVAYYHLPSGQRVNSRAEMEKQGSKEWGVAPHIRLVLRSDEARALWDIQKDNDVLVQANHSHQQEEKQHDIQDLLDVDPQLALGLLVVKTKHIEQGNNLWVYN